MQEQRFKVYVSNTTLASGMTLEMTLLFVEAFFNKYNAEDRLVILREEEKDGKDEDEEW
jgi:hypothetical protein